MILIEITPGPNMAYLALVGARWGWRAGAVSVAGITIGLTAWMLASVAGMNAVVLREPWLCSGLRWGGVGYLLWLATQTWRGEAETLPGRTGRPPVRRRLLVRGMVANILNPKAAVFYVALLPGFTNPAWGEPGVQALTLGALHIGVSILAHGSIMLAAVATRRRVAARPARPGPRALDRICALGLVGIAVWLVWETARTP